jgi:diacylglycerol O-acyltransferase
VPGDLEMLGRGLLGVARQPLRALRSVPSTVPHLTELPGATAFPGGPTLSRTVGRVRSAFSQQDASVLEATTARPPKTPFNGPISPHRRFAFGQLSLDTVKQLKNALGITVNDVVVALCAGAVREWLLERDALPEDPLVAMVPVSVRTDEEKGAFGNRVSMMIVPIATDEADPGRRLARTHELLRSAKERHSAVPANLLTDATAFIPPAVAALASRTAMDILARTRPPLNLVISNVPGPRDPLYLAGAQLQAQYPVSVVVDGVGLNITVMSYRDHLDFGIVADREQVDDVWSLLDGVGSELEQLVAASAGRSGRRRGSAPRARAPRRSARRTPA